MTDSRQRSFMATLKILGDAADRISDDEARLLFLRHVGDNSTDAEWNAEGNWRWKPVGIDVFVEHPYYLGLRGQIYRRILDFLVQAIEGKYVEIIIGGGASAGKTTAADLLIAYSVYELSCLRYPARAFGLMRGSVISILQQSVTETMARKVLFTSIATLIQRSPYFRKWFEPDLTLKRVLSFPNNVLMEPVAGNVTALIGQNTYAALLDEAAWLPVVHGSTRLPGVETYDAAVENFGAMSRRVKFRFLQNGVVPGRVIAVSQARYVGDFISRKVDEARTDPSILTASWAQWDTNPERFPSARFRVAVAQDAAKDSYLLRNGTEQPGPGYDVLEVPDEPNLRREFERDVVMALRELAGRASRSINPFLPLRQVITDFAAGGREHPFTMVETTLEDGCQVLLNRLDLSVTAPRALHIDFGRTHDPTGIAWGYVRGLRRITRTPLDVAEAQQLGIARFVTDGDTFVEEVPEIVIEGMLRVVPPRGGETQLESAVALVLLLRKLGVPIRWVTADSWQSVQALQMLKKRGFVTGEVSTVKTPVAYYDLRAALYDRRLVGYDYAPAIEELIALERIEKDGRLWRVDHPAWMLDATGARVEGHNDVVDGLAGCVHVLTRRRVSWTGESVPVVGGDKTPAPIGVPYGDEGDEIEY